MINFARSLYLHFPHCAHLCNYCDFFKSVSPDLGRDKNAFQKFLIETESIHQKLMDEYFYQFSHLETLYLGGGTPSLWGSSGAAFLNNFFHERNMTFSKGNFEGTIEINPKAWTEEGLLAFRDLGINRASVGIQSLNPNFLKILDRFHDVTEVYSTLDIVKKIGLNFSVDFMIGLPYSKDYARNILAELETILTYDPPHISLYILTTKSNYIHKNHLPNDEEIAREYLLVSEFLIEKGYLHYEVSNFCKPNFHSRHNMAYWEHQSVMALGPSATGFLAEKRLRYKWKPHSHQYEIEILNEDEFFLEKLYMNFRSHKGLSREFLREVPLDIRKNSSREKIHNSLIQKLDQFSDRNLILRKDPWVLNSNGYLILDSLVSELTALY